MSILPQPTRHPVQRLVHSFTEWLLPGSCLLCGADSRQQLLCPGCQNDLPLHNGPQCPVCAEVMPDGTVCTACRKETPHFDRCIAHFRYEFPVDRIIHALKYGHQLLIARWLGETLATHPDTGGHDCLIALPLHPQRLQERGFNQSMEIAKHLAKSRNIPLLRDTLIRRRATPPQAGLPHKQRQANVRGAFECSEDMRGRSVLLLDDVMTTGATLNECARILKLHGAAQVSVAVAARTLRHD